MRILLSIILMSLGINLLQAQDSIPRPRRYMDTAIFAETNTLSRSDYLVALERSFQYFNKIPVVTGSFVSLDGIDRRLRADDSVLSIIRTRLANSERGLNMRNLQMYSCLLENLHLDEEAYELRLLEYDAQLDSLKKDFGVLRRDSNLRGVFRDSALRASFRVQLQELRAKRVLADSVFRRALDRVNHLKAHVAGNLILADELRNRVNVLLRLSGSRAFAKERRYIWEPRNGSGRTRRVGAEIRRGLQQENHIAQYYFANTRNQRLILLLLGSLFFLWTWYNFRSLRRAGQLGALEGMDLRFVNPYPFLGSVLVLLNLAPLFDLNAPAIYLETVGLLLMVFLSVYIWKHQRRELFYLWMAFILLFLLHSSSRFLGLPWSLLRFWNLGVSVASVVLAARAVQAWRHSGGEQYRMRLVFYGYGALHLLAAVSNVFGRVTLSQLFSTTAIYTLTQTLSLFIFVPMVAEAFLLQIQASRIRNQYPAGFDYTGIRKGVFRVVAVVAVILWLVVFTTNMNLYKNMSEGLKQLLVTPRNIGSFQFTVRGVLLFMGIIWLAHFLQRYIAYFWGDTGDEASFDNKGQRSRLLITRLLLLTGGFLLAVAASGLPVDKITVILGALGVGIGLGLQGIVNNFVSGIILIFDRPLRIGDLVEIGDRKGRVKEIGVRSSTLLTADGAEVIIPNGDLLSQNIINWTLSNTHVRMEQEFELDHDGDDPAFRAALREQVLAVPGILRTREPQLAVEPSGGGKYMLKLYSWCADVNKMETTRSEVRRAVQAFIEKN